jgi:hypothetical protein
MDTTLEKLKKYFPALLQNVITKIYRARCARLRYLMNHGIPEDIRWLIEAKVRLSGESSNSFISYMPGTGKSTFAKKRRAKRLKVCHRCARWTCNATCRSLGMVSINRRSVLTPNTLKSTDLGAIGPTLVTWVEEKSLRESNIALSTY